MDARKKNSGNIPKPLINIIKFNNRDNFATENPPGPHEYNEYISHIPPLPKPTPRLREVLLSYNSLHKNITKRRRVRKSRRKKPSAFILFRSFYSLYIGTANNQRTLSGILSKIWKEETDQNVWVKYAFEYSKSSSDLDFTSWLCSSLQFNHNAPLVKTNHLQQIEVEDIFVAKE